jgi:hypothetical protein
MATSATGKAIEQTTTFTAENRSPRPLGAGGFQANRVHELAFGAVASGMRVGERVENGLCERGRCEPGSDAVPGAKRRCQHAERRRRCRPEFGLASGGRVEQRRGFLRFGAEGVWRRFERR